MTAEGQFFRDSSEESERHEQELEEEHLVTSLDLQSTEGSTEQGESQLQDLLASRNKAAAGTLFDEKNWLQQKVFEKETALEKQDSGQQKLKAEVEWLQTKMLTHERPQIKLAEEEGIVIA